MHRDALLVQSDFIGDAKLVWAYKENLILERHYFY